MSFVIKRVKTVSKEIRKAWKIMQEKDGISPYLYFNYMNCVIWETRLRSLWSPQIYYAEDENHKIVMIAPMKRNIITGKIDTLGNANLCDLTDILYGEITEKERAEILCELSKFIGHSYYLSRLYLDSPTLLALGNYYRLLSYKDCVIIKLRESYDSYFKGLSSSVRQNIRTAYNRLNRDGHRYVFLFYVNAKDVPTKVRREAESCYVRRQVSNYTTSKYKALKKMIGIRFFHHDHYSLNRNNNAVWAVLYIDEIVAGMFAGILNSRKDTVSIPRLAINIDYKFYSPGYLLLNETIKYCYENNSIRNIDLCRGTEKYKFDMGGELYKTVNVMI